MFGFEYEYDERIWVNLKRKDGKNEVIWTMKKMLWFVWMWDESW